MICVHTLSQPIGYLVTFPIGTSCWCKPHLWHVPLHAGGDLPKKAVQKADFSPSLAQRRTADLFFPHSHLKRQELPGFNAEGHSHQPCPFSACTHPSARQDHAQPAGLREHTLQGILMTWTCAELPLLAAVLVICWLSKAHSGLFFFFWPWQSR